MMAVDTGYATQDVYNWVRQQNPRRVMAIKGLDRALTPLGLPRRVDVNFGGRRLTKGVRLWPVGVSILKSELFAWLKLPRPEPGEEAPGYAHYPKYPAEFFKQLTAEQLVTKVVKGYAKREWQKIRDRNEALDCRIYARAASIALGIDRWTDRQWGQLRRDIYGRTQAEPRRREVRKEETGEPASRRPTLPTETPKLQPSRPKLVRSSWMNR